MITIGEAIKYLAAGAADPACRKYYGRGTRGTLKLARGTKILICSCADKAFPKLRQKPYHIQLPPEAKREPR